MGAHTDVRTCTHTETQLKNIMENHKQIDLHSKPADLICPVRVFSFFSDFFSILLLHIQASPDQ